MEGFMGPSIEQKRRILVADDVDVLSELISTLLSNDGFATEIANDGEEALEKVESFGPDLVILDLMMPKMHGLDILKKIKSDPATRDIGVIICSTKTFKTEIDQAYEYGAHEFLAKPFQEEELLSAVHRFFASVASSNSREGARQIQAAIEGDVYRPKIEPPNGSMRLWGTRGSIPISGPKCVRHGGNTACLEMQHNGERIIIDAGSGIRDLGQALLSEGPQTLHIFITHTHWDHIQGFPFFVPAFIKGYNINLYASPNLDKDLESIFKGQLDRAYFPVQMEDMQADLNFIHFGEDPIQIGDMEVSWEYTVHPSATVGYKIKMPGRTVAFVPDNEFAKGYLGRPHDITMDHELAVINLKLINFLQDVDVLIHEAQYPNEEYINKIGWGHSSLSNACALVNLVQPKRWIITHHDPMHDDDFLRDKLNITRQMLRELDITVPVEHAFDGMIEYL
jgi:CheY-like chemotaxis protein/phosphoribosyl 1,2-cyclic phosphodiesterase